MNAMTRFTRRIAPALLITGLFSGNVHALGYWGTYSSTMWDTPYEFFTDEDWRIAEDSLQDALNNAKDKESRNWKNPKTPASGTFTILKTVPRKGQQCREVKLVAKYKDINRITGIAFCPADGGGWVAIPGKNRKKF
jgi:hypothetical protein